MGFEHVILDRRTLRPRAIGAAPCRDLRERGIHMDDSAIRTECARHAVKAIAQEAVREGVVDDHGTASAQMHAKPCQGDEAGLFPAPVAEACAAVEAALPVDIVETDQRPAGLLSQRTRDRALAGKCRK